MKLPIVNHLIVHPVGTNYKLISVVYISEEILMTDNAIWWSPEGKHFLYAVFNDTVVQRYDLAYYGDPSNQYLDNKRLSYPKVNINIK